MRHKALLLAGLALLTLATYARVLQNDFVNYDDNDYVTANPIVQQGLTLDGIQWAFGNVSGSKTYWHPVTWLSHMADYQLFQLHPAGHHAMSLLFHTVNVLLLFLVLERMTGARWRSVIVAALWAVHPLQVDTVAWVAERKNLLSALFWLLTLAAYVRYAAKPGGVRYLLVLLAMAMGLMCKPVLVTLPFALLLLDYWPLRRWPSSSAPTTESSPPASTPAFAPASWRRLIIEKLPLLALSVAASLITLAAHDKLGIREESFGLTLSLKIQNATVSYVRYVDNALWPSKLTVLYLHPGQWPLWTVGVSTVVLLIVTVLVFGAARSRPYLVVGWLWFLGVLVPTIGLRQAGVQAMADRFMYLPLLGLIWMIVWRIADGLAGSTRKTAIAAALSTVVILACGAVTQVQIGYWRNSAALWERALAVDPNNYVAHGNLSVVCFSQSQLALARQHAEAAVRLYPGYVEQHVQLGVLSLLEKNPDAAREHFARAARARPDAPFILKRLAAASAVYGDLDNAIAMLSACSEAMPADQEARLRLAMLLAARGRTAEAERHFREALRLQPDMPQVLNELAWLLATSADPAARNASEAVRFAERACELTGRRQAPCVGTLAAAYAEAGRFDDAVRAASEAIVIARGAGETNIVDANQRLLELYRARKPFHASPLK